MKKLIFMALAIVAFFACDSEDIPENINTDNGKEYIVNLGFSGEITIEQTPLTKSEGKDIYGIQVYSRHKDETEYKPYAYGLFNDVSDMSIKLLGGYEYKFEATMIVEGEDVIFHDEKGYHHPFYIKLGEQIQMNNKFVFSSDAFIMGISIGQSTMFDLITYNRPILERYYGLLSDFDPEVNSVADIEMGRVYFGVKFSAEGFKEGDIFIDVAGSPESLIDCPYVVGYTGYIVFDHTSKIKETWHVGDYNEDINVTIIWRKDDGTEIPLMNKDVNFVRNKMTHFIIKPNDNYSDINDTKTPIHDSGISINIKEEPMLITDTLYVGNN